MMGLRYWGWILVVVVGCKARQPEAAGILTTPVVDEGENVEVKGNYEIRCAQSEPSSDVYTFMVRGAVRPEDEMQAIGVSVERSEGSSKPAERLVSEVSGRGSVRVAGPFSLGFDAGALTLDYDAAAVSDAGRHEGILTLRDDVAADGIAVRCRVQEL